MTSLDFNTLSEFLLKHLGILNNNAWDHELRPYSSFLYLAQHLENSFSFYSTFMSNDQLFQASLTAHEVILKLID